MGCGGADATGAIEIRRPASGNALSWRRPGGGRGWVRAWRAGGCPRGNGHRGVGALCPGACRRTNSTLPRTIARHAGRGDDPGAVPRQEYLSLRGGVVGDQLPRLDASVIPVTRGDTLILASDGVRGDFVGSLRLGESPQRVADRILAEFAPGTDDALVLVARYG